jgi:hypothetical protein
MFMVLSIKHKNKFQLAFQSGSLAQGFILRSHQSTASQRSCPKRIGVEGLMFADITGVTIM